MSIWSAGRYELTAERLMPAAEVLVASLGPLDGLRLLDVACGTGNAALLAAASGADATGVDVAERLVAVAVERARAGGLGAAFTVGDANGLAFPDAGFDVVVSVFGIIFADPERCASELLRVVRPGGRIAFTTWVPEGPSALMGTVIREALGGPPDTPRWSSNAFVEQLFAPHPVTFARHSIAFTAPSAAAYVAEHSEHHPLAIAARPALEKAGKAEEVTTRLTALFESANEDPAAFRTTSHYDVVTVVRSG